MPHEAPGPEDLLAIAREVVLTELLPVLPPEKALAARMVANAMAIAARAMARPLLEENEDLHALAAAIRQGCYDPGTAEHDRIAALLDRLTRERCLVSAPRALGKGG